MNATSYYLSIYSFLLLYQVCSSALVLPRPQDYPARVPGTCSGGNQSFDCGNGLCIPFTSVRDCIQNCPDGSDEVCGANLILCDTNVAGIRCGECVEIGTQTSFCIDQRYTPLCSWSSNLIYKCQNTPNCVEVQWTMDGKNDCGDDSDENPCNFNRSNCDPNAVCNFNIQTRTTTCTCANNVVANGTTCPTDPLFNKIPGKCSLSPLQFDCGEKCIPIAKFRNCITDCADGSDEECWLGQVKCKDGCTCVRSDGLSDCPINSGAKLCSVPNTVPCINSSICIYQQWILDGQNDCGDWSDENACLYNSSNCSPFATCIATPTSSSYTCRCNSFYTGDGTSCVFRQAPQQIDILSRIPGSCTINPLQFDCGNGLCLPIAKFRDCVNDCPDGSDEICWIGQVKCDGCKCVDSSQIQQNCMDALSCAPSGMFQCVAGGCVLDSQVLDGFPSCTDDSDENFCSQYATCPATCVYAPSVHNFTCGCPSGTVTQGSNKICQQGSSTLTNDCAAYQLQNTNAASGIYTVYRPNCPVTSANCSLQVIQNRQDGSTNFAQTRSAYKRGFGSLSDEFWIGNDYIYTLTSQTGVTYELLLIMSNRQGTTVVVRYNSFALGPEDDYYRLRLGPMIQGAHDNLNLSRNQRFGTRDNDSNTVGSEFCGDFWQSGWWHETQCDRTGDLNVPYNPVPGRGNLVGIIWTGTPVNARMLKTRMMIRPLGFFLPNTTTSTTITTKRAVFPSFPTLTPEISAVVNGPKEDVTVVLTLLSLWMILVGVYV